jgi:hypothetical protein
MKTRLLFFLLPSFAIFAFSSVALADEPPKLEWRFASSMDSRGIPTTAITLLVNRHAIPINSKVIALFRKLDRESYRDHDIPSDALAACFGWWAGAGDEYYVMRDGNRLAIFHRELSEEAELPRYKLLRRITIASSK